eukprot:m.83792 g.83792  ORF g.83792 m.83792 type:complete len:115 (-) comp11243_c0_seq2:202-546(-)
MSKEWRPSSTSARHCSIARSCVGAEDKADPIVTVSLKCSCAAHVSSLASCRREVRRALRKQMHWHTEEGGNNQHWDYIEWKASEVTRQLKRCCDKTGAACFAAHLIGHAGLKRG